MKGFLDCFLDWNEKRTCYSGFRGVFTTLHCGFTARYNRVVAGERVDISRFSLILSFVLLISLINYDLFCKFTSLELFVVLC